MTQNLFQMAINFLKFLEPAIFSQNISFYTTWKINTQDVVRTCMIK